MLKDSVQLHDQFILECQMKLKKLKAALDMCSPSIQPEIPNNLTKAINALNNTITELNRGTKTMDSLRRFKIQATIPPSSDNQPVHMHVRIDQSYSSKALEPNCYIVITPPAGEIFKTPLTHSKNSIYNYSYDCNLGNKTAQNISFLKASELKFKIFRVPPKVYGAEDILLGEANVGLGLLQYSTTITQKLEFTLNGQHSDYIFECKITLDSPLVQDSGITVDEIISVFEI
ncbi:hypothetical protein TVAG_249900 [Trichomonas vaginalis G3]|uniref:Uncharacterized protein n=2 Tax=Trichomonas vaginalis (strain ATCC PRA-98 / G3) TaxID=412133 RepID=A2DCJ3_TRIV3|nr:hypothetical protein TVAG_249900 [Trichomonas vaginalis G3]|eukprot:XP_001582916.1 hypothetical protein [Trichomonas vaginalis G3]